MEKQEALLKATNILVQSGYTVNGVLVKEPKGEAPLHALDVDEELSELVFKNESGEKCVFEIRHNENTYQLELIENEI